MIKPHCIRCAFIGGISIASICTAGPATQPRPAGPKPTISPVSPAAPKAAPSKTADQLARDQSTALLNQAINTLMGEYESHQRDKTVALREKSNYFTDHPAPLLSPAAVLDATARNYGQVSESCYVRWQLLSFFDATASDDKLRPLAPQIGSLYSRAPAPIAHPSLFPSMRASLDREVGQLSQKDATKVNDAWNQKLRDWMELNKPILKYNDALYALLPVSFGKFKLGWIDLFDRRVPAGAAVGDYFEAMQIAINKWLPTAGGSDRGSLAQMVNRTAEHISDDYPPMIYGQVRWDDGMQRLVFEEARSEAPSKETLSDLARSITTGTGPAK